MDPVHTRSSEILDSHSPGSPILVLLIANCVTLDELPNLSESRFSYQYYVAIMVHSENHVTDVKYLPQRLPDSINYSFIHLSNTYLSRPYSVPRNV